MRKTGLRTAASATGGEAGTGNAFWVRKTVIICFQRRSRNQKETDVRDVLMGGQIPASVFA